MAYLKKNIIILFLIAALIVLSAAVLLAWRLTAPPITLVEIDQQTIRAETANNPLAQYRGLSDRPSLCLNCGMLFNFSDLQDREFVMRDMKFPLDIIFIANDRIIKIAADLPPEGDKPSHIYKSDGPADKVLEVSGGYAAQKGIAVGDRVLINQ